MVGSVSGDVAEAAKGLSKGKRKFARGKLLVREVESFCARDFFVRFKNDCFVKARLVVNVFEAASKNFSTRDFLEIGISTGKRTFDRGRELLSFVSSSIVGSIDGSFFYR